MTSRAHTLLDINEGSAAERGNAGNQLSLPLETRGQLGRESPGTPLL